MGTERFFTIACRETEYWDSDALAEMGVREAFGLYLAREGEGTHLCELKPSSFAAFLGNRFILTDDAPAECSARDDAEQEGGEDTYFSFFDPEKHDSRFVAGPLEIDSDEVDPCEEYGETFHSELWVMAREAWTQNPDEPAILSDSTFDQWESEERAKRRAEMRPALDRDPLPLFTAAAVPIFESIARKFGLDPDNLGNAPWETRKAADSEIKAQFRALAWA